MKNILIIEPHPDDAFLSLSKHIERWKRQGLNVTILTFFKFQGRDSVSFCYNFSLALDNFPPEEPVAYLDKEVGKTIRKLMKESNFSTELFHKKIMKSVIPPFQKEKDFADSLLKKDFSNYDLFLLPFGNYHPEHILTRAIFEIRLRNRFFLYYFEQPYSSRGYIKELEKKLCQPILSEITLSSEEITKKVDDFKAFYPTESLTWDLVNLYKNSFKEMLL